MATFICSESGSHGRIPAGNASKGNARSQFFVSTARTSETEFMSRGGAQETESVMKFSFAGLKETISLV
jgi:hypothetical protein